jgi:protein TonB
MLVDARNRRELRIVVASLAASLGIHAAAFGLVPQVDAGSASSPAPINVTLRTATRTPVDVQEEEPALPAAVLDTPAVAAPQAERVVPPERSREMAKPKKVRTAVSERRPLARAPDSVAPRPLKRPAPALQRPASAPIASPLTAVAREPGRKADLATTSYPATPPPTTPPQFHAEYLKNPPPAYPRRARRDGIEGTVTLSVLVTAAGVPGRVELETSSGSETLDRAALNAVKAWQFAPARRGNEAIDAWVLVPVVFRLESG